MLIYITSAFCVVAVVCAYNIAVFYEHRRPKNLGSAVYAASVMLLLVVQYLVGGLQ